MSTYRLIRHKMAKNERRASNAADTDVPCPRRSHWKQAALICVVSITVRSSLLDKASAMPPETPSHTTDVRTRQLASPIAQECENILLHQRQSGGWPKNYNRGGKLSAAQREELKLAADRNDATIDNGATYTEIRILSEAYQTSEDVRLSDAALRGIAYLLEAQYDNGGWPQRYPEARGYARHITFNDNAMIGVMSLLRDIASSHDEFQFVSADMRQSCGSAVDRGVECILACQVVQNGVRTVWCAQHDHVSYEPRPARSYELASLSGSESVGITRFLMQIESPSVAVRESVNASLAWFAQVGMEGIRVERVKAADQPRGYDTRVVGDDRAPTLWARFYDVETNKPIFCSRDGVPRATLAEISYERRNGYSWLGPYAAKLLAEEAPAWRARLRQPFPRR